MQLFLLSFGNRFIYRNILHIRHKSDPSSTLGVSGLKPYKVPAGSLSSVDKDDWLYFKFSVNQCDIDRF